ncbi:Adamtsl1p [Mactra antiquata]
MGLGKAVCSILIFVVTNILYAGTLSTEECSNSPMDIVLLLDSSAESQVTTFDQEKKFASSLINSMWDGKNRFGLVTYGSTAMTQINLDSYDSITEIEMVIRYLWITTGKADIGGAIKYCLDHLFSSDVGGRVIAPDVLILVTPLDIRNETSVKFLTDELERSETELYVIVASSTIDTFWYKKFVPLDHIIKVNNGNDLIGQLNTIRQTLCQGRGVLRQWSPWSSCVSSCGAGLHRRFRTCEKRHQDDIDCEGELLEDKRCYNDPCTAPVDGSWSMWFTWSDCTKTCGNGTKTRMRTCTDPFPENAGKRCFGESKQKRGCSLWDCPDCNKLCPAGGKLSQECDVCECSDIALYGIVSEESLGPIRDAGIYFKSRMFSPLTTTDYTGFFRLDGICILNEVIVVTKEGYSEETVSAENVNSTHWKINATLRQYIGPVFNFHPMDKTRLVGQSVAMCCQAIGDPHPMEYTWFKGLQQLNNRGTNGTLTFDTLTSNDDGVYHCYVETDAGSAFSKEASLTVIDMSNDSCLLPNPYFEDLPSGCYVDGNTTQSSVINVGVCSDGPCVSNELHDNKTCSEWWGNHCCDPDTFDLVTINCNGFTYQTKRIKTCRCRSCFSKTVITGKAFGRYTNGTDISLKLGEVHVNGKEMARTNMAGIFTFEIPTTTTKIVVKFYDEVFKKFVPSTKVIQVTPGSSTSLKLLLTLRPEPVDFEAQEGLALEVGGTKGLASVGRILIENNALLTESGEPYNGSVKAHIHYMDPRNIQDFQASDGEFTFEENGKICPLETYGVFNTKFEDDRGNTLINNKPLKFEIDPSIYNISTGKDGEPEVELWRMDDNTGSWQTVGKMKFQTKTSRRKLLDMVIVGEDGNSVYVPTINLMYPVYFYRTSVSYRLISYTKYYKARERRDWGKHNVDGRDRYYYVKRRKEEYYSESVVNTIRLRAPDKPKRGACFISVTVYKTLNGVERDSGGTQVTAITKHATENRYMGVDRQPTNRDGHVCLRIFCDSLVYLSAENKQTAQPLIAFPKHDIPLGYKTTNIKNGTQIKLSSNNFENVQTAAGLRYSPVYYYQDSARCRNNYRNDFTFELAESQTGAPKSNFKYDNVYDNKLSWYPNPPKDLTRSTCFLKAFIKSTGDYDLRFIAISRQTDKNGEQYGSYNVGPITEPTMSKFEDRAACIEFRCPGLVNDGGTISTDVDTFLQVKLNPAKPNCRVRKIASGSNIVPESVGTGFTFLAKAGNNYGPRYGVYIGTRNRATMERFCSQGKDTGTIDIGMNPALNAAIEYECS